MPSNALQRPVGEGGSVALRRSTTTQHGDHLTDGTTNDNLPVRVGRSTRGKRVEGREEEGVESDCLRPAHDNNRFALHARNHQKRKFPKGFATRPPAWRAGTLGLDTTSRQPAKLGSLERTGQADHDVGYSASRTKTLSDR